jgi:hypothetical protein
LSISIHELAFLIGRWSGTGHAEYPTIHPVDYREELVFTRNEKDPVIHLEQKTWITSPGRTNGEPIFWESGFLIEKENGLFELLMAQKSGRVEILRCTPHRAGNDAFELLFESASIVNDSRVIRSGRKYTITHDQLEYELSMSTSANPSYQRHLHCRLTRSEK